MKPADFQRIVLDHYRAYGRHDLPWRLPRPDGSFDPYAVLVSELMLQQTQVQRVIPKFMAFMTTFPTVAQLGTAPLAEVLTAWQGLGYNRRAKFLHQAAKKILADYGGEVPASAAELITLPGIGPNTAGAILAYAYDQPAVFIETNVRTVYIHHFFADERAVADAQVLQAVRTTLPAEEGRVWYWALMDYGTHLKQTLGNLSRASTAYTKQSPFEGSRRQIRGHVLRLLAVAPHQLKGLQKEIADERLTTVLEDLEAEGFIMLDGLRYRLRA